VNEKRLRKKIACERVNVLIKEAERMWEKDKELSRKYVKRAWAIKLRFKLKLSKELKTSFCKKCFAVWIPGKTVDIKFNQREHIIEYVCKECGYKKRFKYK